MSSNLEPDVLFGIPVWDSNLTLEEENINALITKYKDLSETMQSILTYEAGGWESDFTKYQFGHGLTQEDKFFLNVLDHTKKVIRSGYSNTLELILNGYVIHVTKGDEYIKQHTRTRQSLITSTVFLTAPDETAALTFYNGYSHIEPYMKALDAIDYTLSHPVVHYKPEVGRILTYPSWLPVGILPGKTDDLRITIDFYFRT